MKKEIQNTKKKKCKRNKGISSAESLEKKVFWAVGERGGGGGGRAMLIVVLYVNYIHRNNILF